MSLLSLLLGFILIGLGVAIGVCIARKELDMALNALKETNEQHRRVIEALEKTIEIRYQLVKLQAEIHQASRKML